MSLKVGIVGLPNVGKSTLFSAITKANTEIANYPFATINPHSGIVMIDDSRLNYLSSIFKPERTIAAPIEFVDIAGLVKGASKGEGLGNQFLANIRECDLIVQVVRAFDNPDIIHVESDIDPVRDIEIINLELVIADLETLKHRYEKVASKARINKDPDSLFEVEILAPLIKHLSAGEVARSCSLSDEQIQFAKKNYHLITLMPTIYVANMSDDDIAHRETAKHYQHMCNYLTSRHEIVIPLSLAIEHEIAHLDIAERADFLLMYGLEESGLNAVAKTAYDLLGLKTFFTVGKDECRAWTFKNGSSAPQCAGIIHTDFEKGFIKAEVYGYDDFVVTPDEGELRRLGKIRMEGKKYLMQDGDIVFFKFNN